MKGDTRVKFPAVGFFYCTKSRQIRPIIILAFVIVLAKRTAGFAPKLRGNIVRRFRNRTDFLRPFKSPSRVRYENGN